jgi:hypothetical protein
VRLRQIAPVGLVLGLTLAGFLGARALGERDARRDSERRADVAAAEIRGHVVQGAALAESLRRFMVGVADGGVTKEQFEGIASSWLSPAGLAGAAWIEQVPASRRVDVRASDRPPHRDAGPTRDGRACPTAVVLSAGDAGFGYRTHGPGRTRSRQ